MNVYNDETKKGIWNFLDEDENERSRHAIIGSVYIRKHAPSNATVLGQHSYIKFYNYYYYRKVNSYWKMDLQMLAVLLAHFQIIYLRIKYMKVMIYL